MRLTAGGAIPARPDTQDPSRVIETRLRSLRATPGELMASEGVSTGQEQKPGRAAATRGEVQEESAHLVSRDGLPEEICFGPFRLLPVSRRLWRGDEAVSVGDRAFDILMALVTHACQVVSKRTLLAQVWPGMVIEESTLRFHMSQLRKVLGHGEAGQCHIRTVQGRGYSFVGPIARPGPVVARTALPLVARHAARLPFLPRVIGREAQIRQLVALMATERLISVVGPPGSGKSTVAVAAAYDWASNSEGAAVFVDLSEVADSRGVATAVAAALGLDLESIGSAEALTGHLGDKQHLLILDNCEHVVEGAAALAERIAKVAPQIRILTTSREILRVDIERVHWLSGLAIPDDEARGAVAELLGHAAVALFVERAQAVCGDFQVDDINAPIIGQICRELDGLPLAIDLAASSAAAYGVRGLATLLGTCGTRCWQGRRTAQPRHQSLSAALDWSLRLLTGVELAVLRRMSGVRGSFTLQAAAELAAFDGVSRLDVLGAIAGLVCKSLICVDRSDSPACYRLLNITRNYVWEALLSESERRSLIERQARHEGGCAQAARSEPPVDFLPACACAHGVAHPPWSGAGPGGQDGLKRHLAAVPPEQPGPDSGTAPLRGSCFVQNVPKRGTSCENGSFADSMKASWRLPPRELPVPPVEGRLTSREQMILGEIEGGYSNKEIARALGITAETVKSHVKRIFVKLGVDRRAQAVQRGHELGYLGGRELPRASGL